MVLTGIIGQGAIHKRRLQNFANFWPPSPLSASVCIEPTSLPRASASVRQNLYCVVNFLRDFGHLISHFLDEWQICEVKNLLSCPLHFWPKGQNSRDQKCTKSVFLTKNFGQKYLGQKCTKSAFLIKFSDQKWPKFLTTTVVSKCCIKKGHNSRGQKCTKSVFLTKNFGRKYLCQKCTKTAFLTKFSDRKRPKIFVTTVVSKCCVKL